MDTFYIERGFIQFKKYFIMNLLPFNVIHHLCHQLVYRISKKPPGSAVPHISGPYSLSDVERGFLVLMTDGLYSIASKTDRDCSDVNQAVARMVAREMCGSNTMHSVAQSVISKFQESLHSIFMDSQGERHDCRIVGDCTLLVHNLGFPLGKSETYPESYCTVTPSSMIADKTVRYAHE